MTTGVVTSMASLPSAIPAHSQVDSGPKLTLHLDSRFHTPSFFWGPHPDYLPLSSLIFLLFPVYQIFPFSPYNAQVSFILTGIFSIMSSPQTFIWLLYNLAWHVRKRPAENVEADPRTMSGLWGADAGTRHRMGFPLWLSFFLLNYLSKTFAFLHLQHQLLQAAIGSCRDIVMSS